MKKRYFWLFEKSRLQYLRNDYYACSGTIDRKLLKIALRVSKTFANRLSTLQDVWRMVQHYRELFWDVLGGQSIAKFLVIRSRTELMVIPLVTQ